MAKVWFSRWPPVCHKIAKIKKSSGRITPSFIEIAPAVTKRALLMDDDGRHVTEDELKKNIYHLYQFFSKIKLTHSQNWVFDKQIFRKIKTQKSFFNTTDIHLQENLF
jgi:hypothetical protein